MDLEKTTDRIETAVVIEHAIPQKVLPDEKELACNLVDEPNICTDNTMSKENRDTESSITLLILTKQASKSRKLNVQGYEFYTPAAVNNLYITRDICFSFM